MRAKWICVLAFMLILSLSLVGNAAADEGYEMLKMILKTPISESTAPLSGEEVILEEKSVTGVNLVVDQPDHMVRISGENADGQGETCLWKDLDPGQTENAVSVSAQFYDSISDLNTNGGIFLIVYVVDEDNTVTISDSDSANVFLLTDPTVQ